MPLLSTLQALLADAPSHVRTMAFLAGVVSLGGVALATWHTVRYVAAARLLALGKALDPSHKPLEGPLAVLNVFGSSERPDTTLSPDAVWGFVTARLHFEFDLHRAQVRFLAYLPLLVGLAATMLGLAGLIDQLGLGMSDGVRASLRGVFLGTLAGILGSALVGVTGLALSSAGRRTIAAIEQHVHTRVLPAVPERRIGVRVEEAVISVISERSRAVVAQFHNTLQPVANELSAAASQSSKAAVVATQAFDQAVAFLRDSGDLRAAAKVIAEKLTSIRQASANLARAAQSSLDAATVEATVRQKLVDATAVADERTDRLIDAGKSLESGIEKLAMPLKKFTTTAADFATSATRVGDEISGAREAFATLSERIESRNELEKQHIEELHRKLDGIDEPLSKLHTVLSEITHEVATARSATEVFRQQATSRITARIDEDFLKLATKLEDVLRPIAGIIPSAANELTLAAKKVQGTVDETTERLPEMQRLLAPMQDTLATYVSVAQDIATELQKTNSLLSGAVSGIEVATHSGASESTPVSEQAVLSELKIAIRELSQAVKALRASISAHEPKGLPHVDKARFAAAEPSQRQPMKPRKWWQHLFRSEWNL